MYEGEATSRGLGQPARSQNPPACYRDETPSNIVWSQVVEMCDSLRNPWDRHGHISFRLGLCVVCARCFHLAETGKRSGGGARAHAPLPPLTHLYWPACDAHPSVRI